MSVKSKNRHWLRKVLPLWLREKIYFRFYAGNQYHNNFYDNTVLEFAPDITFTLLPTDISHKAIALCGFYELSVTRAVVNLAMAGGLMVDVGANYGYYSCLWAASRKNNRVIAFEASPKNYRPLSRNVRRNKLESQIEVIMKAVGHHSGSSYFNLGPEDQSGWGGLSVNGGHDCVEISVVSLDDFFYDMNDICIDVLKIDTEGADAFVLKGAAQLLRERKIRHIFFEENLVRMKELSIHPGTAQKILREHGYKVRHLSGSEWYAAPDHAQQ